MNVQMKCGHVSNAKNSEGNPVCVICVGITPNAEIIVPAFDLTGRKAACLSVHNKDHTTTLREPALESNYGLAFFEYRGPGSDVASDMCVHCHFRKRAHDSDSHRKIDHEFESHGPFEYDTYYCGHMRWD